RRRRACSHAPLRDRCRAVHGWVLAHRATGQPRNVRRGRDHGLQRGPHLRARDDAVPPRRVCEPPAADASRAGHRLPRRHPRGLPAGYGWGGRQRTRDGYAEFMKSASFWGNNFDDVELDVAFPASLQWRSTTPPVATTMLEAGIVASYAAAITSPVLAVMGE